MKDKNGQTPLMLAIEVKNFEYIKNLLSKCCNNKYSIDVNIKDKNGNSPLIYAIKKFNNSFELLIKLIDLLIKNGANKDDIDNDEFTVLHVVCQYNLYQYIPKLITENNINMKNKNGKTPLMIAIEGKNIECIKNLLSKCCSSNYSIDINTKDKNGNSPLINTIIKFNNSKKLLNELIDLFIENKVNKDDINNDKLTALHVVCQYNLYQYIPKLITENNINMKNKNGQTPLMIAYNKKKNHCVMKLMTNEIFIKNYKITNNDIALDLLNSLLEQKVEDEKIYEIFFKWKVYFGLKQFKKKLNIMINNKSFIKTIIKYGIYIHRNNQHEEIKTPLIFSITNNFKELTKSILKGYEEIIPEVDDNNKYCLFYAIDNPDEEYFELLMKSKKIDFERCNDKKETALEYSLTLKKENIDYNINEQFQSNKNDENESISIEDISQNSYNEIHIACLNQNINLISMLIQCGFNIDDRCKDGSTPLLLSVKQNKKESVKYLIEHQADISIPDHQGDTSISYLLKHLSKENSSLLELLLPYITMNQNYPPDNLAPLNYLVKYNVEALDIFLNIGHFNIDELDFGGNNLLFSTIKCNPENLKLIKIILSHGANPNQLDSENKTPLIYAIEKESIDLVRLLLEYGADSQLQISKGLTPLKYACIKNNNNIIKELFKANKK
eukprot:jgi/Orpsp1_1/1176102/evm.model.c7180000056410.1